MKHDQFLKRLKTMEAYLEQHPERKEYAGLFMTGFLGPMVDEREWDTGWSRCLLMMENGVTHEPIDPTKIQ